MLTTKLRAGGSGRRRQGRVNVPAPSPGATAAMVLEDGDTRLGGAATRLQVRELRILDSFPGRIWILGADSRIDPLPVEQGLAAAAVEAAVADH